MRLLRGTFYTLACACWALGYWLAPKQTFTFGAIYASCYLVMRLIVGQVYGERRTFIDISNNARRNRIRFL